MGSAVWALGRSLRKARYDLGIDVRGDILTVLVLALAGIPRRVGWAMGGGGFLLTDVADWIPGRHEVSSRLALLGRLGIAAGGPARVAVNVTDRDRTSVARWLREAWEEPRPVTVRTASALKPILVGRAKPSSPVAGSQHDGLTAPDNENPRDDADWLHAGRFGEPAPLLAAHLGAGTAAKRWPPAHWKALITRFLDDGWRVVVIGGPEDADAARGARAASAAPRLDRADDRPRDDGLPRTCRPVPRRRLRTVAPCGLLGDPLRRPLQRDEPAGAVAPWSRRSLVLRHDVPCRPCHHKVCPLADHPCMTGLNPDRVYRAAQRWWARLHHAESPHAPL